MLTNFCRGEVESLLPPYGARVKNTAQVHRA